VKEAGWDWDKKKNVLFWYIPKTKTLEKEKEWEGPPLMLGNRVKEFKRKCEKTFTKKGRIYARVKRKYTAPENLIKELINQKYFRERVKKCRIY